MYKITLFDQNGAACFSGTASFFTDDIEDFQSRWLRLGNIDEARKDRFLRSKAGEMVTDYYSDDPELNIVQYDDCTVYAEKNIVLEDVTFKAYNAYMWPEQYHVDRWEICFKWICFKGEYCRIASYKAQGVCMFSDYLDCWTHVNCYGNPVIENIITYSIYPKLEETIDGRLCTKIEDFRENHLETICFLENGYFKSEQEMQEDMQGFEVTDEIMDILFGDVIGEAG